MKKPWKCSHTAIFRVCKFRHYVTNFQSHTDFVCTKRVLVCCHNGVGYSERTIMVLDTIVRTYHNDVGWSGLFTFWSHVAINQADRCAAGTKCY